ncbi:MAG: hypothetical protein U5K31_05440 [Balneolaceae bacterium]|nr:hypothetical protein [Balneolaceae bacterium]
MLFGTGEHGWLEHSVKEYFRTVVRLSQLLSYIREEVFSFYGHLSSYGGGQIFQVEIQDTKRGAGAGGIAKIPTPVFYIFYHVQQRLLVIFHKVQAVFNLLEGAVPQGPA